MIRTWVRLKLTVTAAVSVSVVLAVPVLAGAVGGVATATSPALGRPADCGSITGRAGTLSPAQERNAKIVTAVALGRNLGTTGAAIGIAVALAESTLFNYANDGTSTLVGSAEGRQLNDAERAVARKSLAYPHDKVGNNLDSIGLFQQRPMSGWGPPEALIDPATAAGLFFDRLVHMPGWNSLPPWTAAQTVQGSPSSDGGIYRRMYEQAVVIEAALTRSAAVTARPTRPPTNNLECAPAGSPGTGQARGSSPSEGAAAWGGYANGQIPANALCPVPTAPSLLLECNAAKAFDDLNTAFRSRFGQNIGITDGYRSYDEQVACRAEKGALCAIPGTSNHGWAKAVDIGGCCGVNSGAGAAFQWLTANASTYGWVHPGWAQPGGSKPEPWHWEFGSIS